MGGVVEECRFFLRLVVFLGFLGRILGQQADPCSSGPLVMQGYTGTFSSPNYPQSYPPNTKCSWRVKSAAKGRQVWLVFDGLFKIERFSACSYDSLKIYDGPDERSTEVGNLCGDKAPQPVNLSGNEAFVTFTSDQAVNEAGFKLTWRTCPPDLLLCDVGRVCLSPAKKCDMAQNCQDWTDELNCDYGQQHACGGEVLTDGPGNITTLNYPVFFPPGLSCTWNIVATQGKRLRASFTGLFDVPCLTNVKVAELGPDGSLPNGTSTFCGSQTPPDVIVTAKERLKIEFQPPMVIPGKGFALSWETSCQENYFSCPEGSCLVPEKVCDGADDCQHGEDESYSACPGTTTSPIPSSTAMMTTDVDRKPESETALAPNTVTPRKWYTYYHTIPQGSSTSQKTVPSATSTQQGLIHTSTGRKDIPKASTPTPTPTPTPQVWIKPQVWINKTGTGAWNGTLGGSTMVTTQSLDTYPTRLCYSCHDDGACASPVDSTVPVTECLDDQACWVERILGPGKEKERIVYRRGCGSLCPDHWTRESCTDGWLQVCRLCCSEDLCNTHLLNGDDKRFANQVSEPNMVGVLEPNWVYFFVASLSAVVIFTA